MKLKAAQNKANKVQANGVQKAKAVALKKGPAEKNVKAVMAAGKGANKKRANPPAKVVPPKKVEEEEEDDEESEEEDSGTEIQAEEGLEGSDDEGEEDEDEDDDDEDAEDDDDDLDLEGEDDDEDDEDDDVEEDDEDDEENAEDSDAPVEAPIGKKEQLTKKENTKKEKGPVATAKEEKPQAADKDKKAERTLYVSNLKAETTDQQLIDHFKVCGTVEKVTIKRVRRYTIAFVVLATREEAVKAKDDLHLSVLNNLNIRISLSNEARDNTEVRDEAHTVIVKNNNNYESYPPDKLKAMFAKCGAIKHLQIHCAKNVLAFITFVEEASAKKALKLNGTTVKDFTIEIEKYAQVKKPKTTIFLQNVKPGTTEEQVREFFAETGPIQQVTVLKYTAIVRFEDEESYCKSFLLHEERLNGERVLLNPYSEKKGILDKIRKQKRPHSFASGPRKFKKFSGPGPAKKFRHN